MSIRLSRAWIVGCLVLATPAASRAQNFDISVQMSGGGGQQASTTGKERGVRITKIAVLKGFPAGNYSCTSEISGSAGCTNYTEMVLRDPNGIPIGTDQDYPYCAVSHLRVDVYLSSNAPSGEYSCYVYASGNDGDGNPINGWGEGSSYWGDSLNLQVAKRGSTSSALIPIRTM